MKEEIYITHFVFLFLLERKMPLATQLLQLVYVFSTFLPHFSERSS